MANKTKGEVGFEADGKPHTLVYSVNALCVLESELDDMSAALAALMRGGGKRRITTLRTVFRAGLIERHGDLTAHEAGAIMSAVGLEQSFELVADAIMLAFPHPQGEGGSTGDSPLPTNASDGIGSAYSPAG